MKEFWYDANCRFEIQAESEEEARAKLENKLKEIEAGYVETYIVGEHECGKVKVCVYLDCIHRPFNNIGEYRFVLPNGEEAENFATIKLDKNVWNKFYYENMAAEWKCSSEEYLNKHMSCDSTETLILWLKEGNYKYDVEIDDDITILPFYVSFIDDKEKMNDFFLLSKEEFLNSYSYLCEGEYEQTRQEVARKWSEIICG